MRHVFLIISIVLLTTFVVFLSVGVSISKMQCSKDAELFLGTEVPNCMQEEKTACSEDSKEFSCCNDLQLCCPQKNDDSCASETANIQFNFETLVPSFSLDFKKTCALVYTCLLHDKKYALKYQFIYIGEIPFPPNLHSPELAEIQSFLL